MFSHLGDPGFSPGQFMWDLWWTRRHWGKFSPDTLVSLANYSTDCFTFVIILG
jgi:hypothetical protein